jgi:hypothetical protein
MKSSVRASFVSAAVLAVLGVAGCSSSKPTPTSSDYDNVASSTAALIATPGGGGEVTSMYEVATVAVGTSPVGVTASAQGSFSSVHAGVTYSFTVTCTDSSGAALPHCGSTTNDAQASVNWSGNLTLPDYTASVTRTGNWSVTGVQTGVVTFNGTGSFNYSSNFASATAQSNATLSYAASYDAVVYNVASQLVTGGSLHYTIDASGLASSSSGEASGSFTIDAQVTFANGVATLTLDGSHTYMVSATGVVTKV